MRPLIVGLHGCLPGRTGVITFHVTAQGSDGQVTAATVAGGDFAAEIAGTPEEECAVAIIVAAHFPPFTRETLTFDYPYSL